MAHHLARTEPNRRKADLMTLDISDEAPLPEPLLRRFNQLAERHREPFIAMIDRLSEGRERNIDWWLSGPAGRNPHISPLFTRCMKLALVRALLEDGLLPEVIITDSRAMAGVLRAGLRGGGVRVVWRFCWRGLWHVLRQPIWGLGSSLFHAGGAWLGAWLSRRLRRAPGPASLILIDIMVLADSMRGGQFADRYFTGMRAEIPEEVRSSAWYLPTFYQVRAYPSLFRALRRAADPFLFREDYLKLSDYLFAFGHFWRASRFAIVRTSFAGFDVGPLLREDLRRGKYRRSAIDALLCYRFWPRLKASGVSLRTVVDWFEGQDIDRGSIAGLSWFWPEVPVTGYCGVPVSPFYLCMTPSPAEVRAGVAPRRLALTSRLAAHALGANRPDLDVVVVPAFRYRQLYSFRRSPEAAPFCRVLVALPIFPSVCLEILRSLERVAATLAPAGGFQFLIKAHPAFDEGQIARMFLRPWPAAFTWVSGPFHDWLSRADIVIGAGSVTLLEALACGVPVLVFASRSAVTEHHIPAGASAESWSLCFDDEGLIDCLKQQRHPRREAMAASAGMLEALFDPVTPEGVAALIDPPSGPNS